MARTVAEGFDVFLERLTPTAAQRSAAAAHRGRVETSLKNKLTINSIRETGSFHHGTGVKNDCDVDVLASIGNAKPTTSDTALSWVKSALAASFPTTVVRVSRPAGVVEFAGGDETWEVIPGFLRSTANDKYVWDIPGPSSGWIDSAPLEHLTYVNECNTKAGVVGGTKKLARLMKAWKYYNNVPMSSFYLEMRAAQHVANQKSFVPVFDVCWLLEELVSHHLAGMNDPKQASGRIYPCSSDAKKIEALSKLSTAATRARKALEAQQAGNNDTAFYYLDLLFGGEFPAR